MLDSPIALDMAKEAIRQASEDLSENYSMLPLYQLISSYAGREITGSPDTQRFLSRIYGATMIVRNNIKYKDKLDAFYEEMSSLLKTYHLKEDGTARSLLFYYQEELTKIINEAIGTSMSPGDTLHQMMLAVESADDRQYMNF